MIMRSTLIWLCLFCVSGLWAQRDEAYVKTEVETFVSSLAERGIKKYFHTRRYCSGNIEMFVINGKNCMSKGTYYESYIFWAEGEQAYVKKIDNCGLYLSVALQDDAILKFAREHVVGMEQEEVKPYKSETYTGTPEQRKPVQPCFREYDFATGNEAFSKQFNLFDISNDSDGKNLNYDHNQALKLIKLNGLIDQLIVTEKRSFKRQIQ